MKNYKFGFLALLFIATACEKVDVSSRNNSYDIDWLQSEKWMDYSGWTDFTPSTDTRIMYVSEDGDNASASFYLAGDAAIGSNPFNPSGAIKTFATYAAAAEHVRDSFPDWILFKRGGKFKAKIRPKSGRSQHEFSLIGAYGATGSLPVVSPEDNTSNVLSVAARRKEKRLHYTAITAIDFYAESRDPSSPNYTGPEGSSGFNIVSFGSGDDSGDIKHFLLEGCKFRFFDNNVINVLGDEAKAFEIVIRRCEFSNNYSDGEGHCQGLYAYNVDGLLLEENIFDHNGWLNQYPTTPGPATMFNHNTYLVECRKVKFENNIFLRSSSIHNKFALYDVGAKTTDVALIDNIYVDGEIGASFGYDIEKYGEGGFQNVSVNGNIFTEIGRSEPTDRALGWGFGFKGLHKGEMKENYMLFNNLGITNVWAYSITGDVKDVEISNNVVYDIYGTALILSTEKGKNENINVHNNIFHDKRNKNGIVRAYDLQGISLSNNVYYSLKEEPLSYLKESYTLADWNSVTGDNSSLSNYSFPDTTRCIETYQAYIGAEASIDAFIEACKAQNRYSWNENYTAEKVGNWIKAGFAH